MTFSLMARNALEVFQEAELRMESGTASASAPAPPIAGTTVATGTFLLGADVDEAILLEYGLKTDRL